MLAVTTLGSGSKVGGAREGARHFILFYYFLTSLLEYNCFTMVLVSAL